MTEVKLTGTFTIEVDGDPRDIKMTFGLLNELVRVIGDVEGIAEISFNNDLRDAVLNEVFSERDEQGRIKEPVNLFNLAVDPDDVVNLLEWVGAHVTDFLLKQMLKTKVMVESNQGRLKALMPTSTGSEG